MRTLVLLGALTASLVSGGCSSTPHRIASEEFAGDIDGKPFSNFLVVSVYDDRTFRVSGETAIAEELKARGVAASPSYDLLSNPRGVGNTQLSVLTAAGSYDAVLTIGTLDPGYDYDAGDYMASRGLVYMLGGRPGAGTDLGALIAWSGSGAYSLHVGLWDARSGKPVWQVTTDSTSTGSETGDLKALADFIVDELRKKRLL
jgi:hypothetical protein